MKLREAAQNTTRVLQPVSVFLSLSVDKGNYEGISILSS